jgi:DNA-binding IclR family transcriptional regulator
VRSGDTLTVPSQSISRLGDLLGLFTVTRVEIGLSELALELTVSKPTALRLARSLVTIGLLDQDPETRAYRLGTRFLELGTLVAGSLDIRKRALPVLRSLCEEIGETTYLMVLKDRQVICIERIEGTHPLRDAVTQIGTVLPLHVGAAGAAILAHLPAEEVDEILMAPLEMRTPFTLTSPSAIRDHLLDVRARGFAVSLNDLVVGTGGVSAPIFASDGAPVAAISAGGIVTTIESRTDELAEAVLAASSDISHQLGWSNARQLPIQTPDGRE